MSDQFSLLPDREGASVSLPPVVMVMVFLASLALVGVLAIDRALDGARADLAGAVTLELPAASPSGTVDDLVARITDLPGVELARQLSQSEMQRLLEPWLGDSLPSDIVLPLMLDVRLTGAAAASPEETLGEIRALAPDLKIEDHRLQLLDAIRSARWLQRLALSATLLVALATALVIVFATRAAIQAHFDVISLVHQIGASDRWVARRFQDRTVGVCLQGSLAGGLLALGAVFLIGWAGGRGEGLPGAGFAVGLPELLAIAFTVLAAVVIGGLSARWTVLRALARLP